MSDEQENPADAEEPQPLKPVTVEDFESVDFVGALPECDKVECHDLQSQYIKLARDAEEKQDHSAARVFGLLASVCSFHLKVEDRAEPWGPMWTVGNRRSMIPADYEGEQSAVFLAIVDKVANPGLRARLADITWSNNRETAGRAGAVAVAAYQECADGLLSGKFKPYLDEGRASFEALKNVQRAFIVAQATTKKDTKKRALFEEGLKATARNLYAIAKDAKEYVVFQSAAEIMLQYELLAPNIVAKDCEELAQTKPENGYAMPIKALWRLAAQLYRNADDRESEQRCLFEAVKQTLEMRKQVTSAGAEAHWVQQALLELRHVEGQDELEEGLLLELRRLQRASMKEFTKFTAPLEVADLREDVIELFGALPLAQALYRFGLVTQSTPIEALKQQARNELRDSPLSAMMAAAHLDEEGKSVARSPGAETEGEQPDAWYRHKALQTESFRRQRCVAGVIDPARVTIHSRLLIEERHLEPIVFRSPLVPQSQAHLIVLGLTRYFQGDFMSAAHLLIPQLEPCFRHILKVNGHDPVKQFDNGTEEDFDINQMFSRMRPELEKIFGEDLVYEMDLLFVGRPGPSLRNALAHGRISTGACFSADMLYACWLIYRLCMGFVLSQWDDIAKELSHVSEPASAA